MLSTQTYKHNVLIRVNSALAKIEEYNRSRNMQYLSDAESELDLAIAEDPDYLDGIFYTGLVKELVGKAADASPIFERIINEVKDKKIQNEARYNLSISYYHRYNHTHLEKAVQEFNSLLEQTNDIGIKRLIYANLAQVYAMWMIPEEKQKKRLLAGEKSDHGFINEKFNEFKRYKKLATSFLGFKISLNNAIKNKIRAVVKNAEGMALMYYSDYLSKDEKDKEKDLNRALRILEESDRLHPNDWANISDIGSAYWRLAYLYKSGGRTTEADNFYDKALEQFTKVVTSLRPNYGFALYEIGRIHRTKGDFEKAAEYFDKSLGIEVKYRDVSDNTVNAEKARCQDNDSSLP